MLEIVPEGIFSPDYGVFENKNVVAVVQNKAFSLHNKGTLLLNDKKFFVYREGIISGAFLMETEDNRTIARAEKPGFARDMFIIKFDNRELTLKSKIFSLSGKYYIYESEVQTGEISQLVFSQDGCFSK